MKYSTLFTFLSIVIFIFPWTGLPFGFLRLILSLFAVILFFLSLGLYQKEQKISDFIRDVKQSSNIHNDHTDQGDQDHKEGSHQGLSPQVATVRTERKKLSDVLS
jgi:hypothetical protein